MAATTRITLTAECPDLQDGLQARIHDPLWLLARQWQFGEFKGEDSGSPAAAQVAVGSAPIRRYRPGPASTPNGVQPYSASTMALETLVEREAVVSGTTPSRRWAAEAGLHFIRLLTLHEAGTYRALFLRSAYALEAPPSDQRRSLDGDSQRGGLLRQGSILTVTSYATRTSPVIRGKWILENLLGSPPPRPPANSPSSPCPAAGTATTPTSTSSSISRLRLPATDGM